MERIIKIPYENANTNPVDRYLAVEKLRRAMLPILEELVDDITKINIDVNAENQLLINDVAISNDFNYCTDFVLDPFRNTYLLFSDNGEAKFVYMGAQNLEDADKVYEVFGIKRSDKRIKVIHYRDPSRYGDPLISPLAPVEEWDEVMRIAEEEGLTDGYL